MSRKEGIKVCWWASELVWTTITVIIVLPCGCICYQHRGRENQASSSRRFNPKILRSIRTWMIKECCALFILWRDLVTKEKYLWSDILYLFIHLLLRNRRWQCVHLWQRILAPSWFSDNAVLYVSLFFSKKWMLWTFLVEDVWNGWSVFSEHGFTFWEWCVHCVILNVVTLICYTRARGTCLRNIRSGEIFVNGFIHYIVLYMVVGEAAVQICFE